MGLKTNAGGMGYRNTERRVLFINTVISALPQMMGNETAAPLWASLRDVIGAHMLAALLRLRIRIR